MRGLVSPRTDSITPHHRHRPNRRRPLPIPYRDHSPLLITRSSRRHWCAPRRWPTPSACACMKSICPSAPTSCTPMVIRRVSSMRASCCRCRMRPTHRCHPYYRWVQTPKFPHPVLCFQCIALGAGAHSAPQFIALAGERLYDVHAEVLARRALLLFLYQVDSVCGNKYFICRT
jgi:hypothetical protein